MSAAAAPEHAARALSARVADLFERHGRMAYGICRAMLRDVHEAEDATQEAFLSAHRALLGGARVRDEGAWIATIARNECRARIAAGMRAPLPVGDEDLAELVDGVDDAERRLQARALRDALHALPERQREAVVLRYVFGLRYGEVAKALGLSLPATEALLFRARRAMRRRLRHATAAVLAVPLSVREELALALPGFEAQTGSGAAAAGLAGGLLAKLASAPAAAKLATATVAVSTVGAVGAVDSDRPAPDVRAAQAGLVAVLRADTASSVTPGATATDDDVRAGRRGDEGGSGPGGGELEDGPDGDRKGDRSGWSHDDDLPTGQTSGRGGSGSGRNDDDGMDDDAAPGVEGHDASGPGSGLLGSMGGDDDAGSDSSGTSSERSGSSGSGSGDPGEPNADSSHGSGSSGSGSEQDDGSSGSGSGDAPDDEEP